MIWIYPLIYLAAFFNACMDAFENSPNFDESIFVNWNKRFWCKDVSCNYVRLILGYRPDGWHICKSLMWICLIAGAIIAWYSQPPAIHWFRHFIGLSSAPIFAFPLFYHVVFRIK